MVRVIAALDRVFSDRRSLMENILLDRPAVDAPDAITMHNANALKIGVFGADCSSGRSATKVPERWSATCRLGSPPWRMRRGSISCSIARWKGYGGESDFHGSTLETITWAVGLLSATTVFGTVHAPLFHR